MKLKTYTLNQVQSRPQSLQQNRSKQLLSTQNQKESKISNLKDKKDKDISEASVMGVVDSIDYLLSEAKLTDDTVFAHLSYIIFDSKKIAMNGEEIPDYHASLAGIKIWRRLRGYGRKKLINNNRHLEHILDKKGLDPLQVFKKLYDIMHNAYDIVKIGDDFRVVKLHSLQEQSIREYSIIKSYISDDKISIMNFFNVDKKYIDKILAIKC